MLISRRSEHTPDLICLSHLRWNFVFQRPHHLMVRCASDRRVYFVEEPVFHPGITASLRVEKHDGVTVVIPQLPSGLSPQAITAAQRRLLDGFLHKQQLRQFILWYYTPMALAFTDHWSPVATVYDCMDELSLFKDAPPQLKQYEAKLMKRASLVLTGGHSLYEAKRHSHHNIHPVPSSVDVHHFRQARSVTGEPDDQAGIPHPRLGFMGVIDERMDLHLLEAMAEERPDWHFVMIGPVVKIDPVSLPRRANVHYLGSKTYDELPRYLAGWDVALMPFALNDATRYISPTKTPEYLAAGKPVVSTAIRDVVRPYGESGLVRIADDAPAFVRACADAMAEDAGRRLERADAFLRHLSWDETWARIRRLMDEEVDRRAYAGSDAARAAAVL